MKMRIAHLTTQHARDEVRIFHKECTSIAKGGYDVHFVVADGKGFDQANSVKRHDSGRIPNRFHRVFFQPWKIYSVARRLHAAIYHLHEPELLLIAPLLKNMGAHVVYDSHEDVPRAILGRDWVHPLLRPFVSFFFEMFENTIARQISAVIAATPHIAQRFSKINHRTITVNNFPLQSEMCASMNPCGDVRTVCYIGGMNRTRGLFEMIHAMEYVDAQLILAGPFESSTVENEARQLTGWSHVDNRGIVSRKEVYQIMAHSCAGLLFFHPEPNHVNAQPNKMFEYMSAGIPVIASNFPLWREIIEGNDCGICVDPLSPKAIAGAIDFLVSHPDRARQMGENGCHAVHNRYNWSIEEEKLLRLYKVLEK